MAKWGKRGFLQRLDIDFRPWRSRRSFQSVAWKKNQGFRSKATGNKSSAPIQWGKPGKTNKAWGPKKRFFSISSSSGYKQPQPWRSSPKRGNRLKPPSQRPPMRKRTFALLALVILLLCAVPSFVFVERNLRPPLMNIAKVRVKQVATQAINKAITEQVANHSEAEKLIDWKMNDSGKISGFMLNYGEHMAITSETIKTVQSTLSEIKHIPERIPIGHALNSAIISSFGPRVPVKFEPVGAVKVELGTRERNAAINMVLVEVYIKVMAEVSIIIPFDTAPELVQTEIPISYMLVVGDVPMYYYDSSGKAVGDSAPQAPNISVPLSPGVGISSSESEGTKEEEEGHESGTLQLQIE